VKIPRRVQQKGDKPGGTAGYQAHPRLICPSVRPSVCLKVHF
jgi:hypothetical protein